jgi:uncharacterized CHY-type Zn-finger protein
MCPESVLTSVCLQRITEACEADERLPTYACRTTGVLGCPHYVRACKIRAPCCGKFFTCRKCHDEMSDHDMLRGVKEVMCMRCNQVQPPAAHCNSAQCTSSSAPPFAEYYCAVCVLYARAGAAGIYHCPQCQVCRVGVAKDFIHCSTCNVCIALVGFDSHCCVVNSHDADCPICHEPMGNLKCDRAVAVPRCGHPLHQCCLESYVGNGNMRCPVCLKLMGDMAHQFAAMRTLLQCQPMPSEYAQARASIGCVCCGEHTIVPYHFLGHACGHCGSFNTQVLRLEGLPNGCTMGGEPIVDEERESFENRDMCMSDVEYDVDDDK